MTTRRRPPVLVVTVLATLLLSPAPFHAGVHSDFAPRRVACADLALLQLPSTEITSAETIPAQDSMAAYCRVLATVAPQTDIELRLPARWRKRLLHLGGAGFDGTIPNLDLNGAQLRQGYALAGSNGGHRASEYPGASFGLDSTLADLYAHTAIDTTVQLAKAVARAHYGAPPHYSYFSGCSNGGRGAFNAAAKYGDEYDGVVAAAPSRNLPGLVSEWIRNATVTFPRTAKLTSLNGAATAACDGLDGLQDGVISNPDACQFDPEAIRCPAGADHDACLTDREIAAVRMLYTDLRLSTGKTVYSRFGFGSLAPWLPFHGFLGASHMQYLVLQNPTWTPATFQLDADYPAIVDGLEGARDFSADTKPLARYLRSGRKMIVWHGTDDTLLSHYDTVRSYNTLANAAGHGARNARLYTPPGVNHCGGGPGADRFDMIGALAEWVEKGRAPGTLSASKVDAAGRVLWTRPLCEYPKYPRYIGFGDPNDAANFRCVR